MPFTFHLIPHTHWDREWYLPQAAFRSRLVALLDDLIEQLGRTPSLRSFLVDGQTVLLEDYLAVRPDRAEPVARLVREGRIETGPWYVLADEQIPAAESLIRNLLAGARDAGRLGRRLPVLYSPDAFGHPGSLPLLALEFGLRYGVVWRGLDPARIGGRDLFYWESPDGRSVLCLHLPPEGYELGSALLVADPELPGAWARVRDRLVARAATRQIAVLIGADHHAADPRLGALPDRLARLEPEAEFRLSSLAAFFEAAERELPVGLEAVQGECRAGSGATWSLQGTHATRAPFKRRHSALELMLVRSAEPLAALASGGCRVQPVLQRAWRDLVQCQFHDTLCGTTSDVVHRAALARLDEVEAGAREVVRTAIFALLEHDPDRARERPDLVDPTLFVWNPAARRRAGVVRAEVTFFRRDVPVGPPGAGAGPRREGRGARPFALRFGDGTVVPVQILAIRPGLERLEAARHYPDLDEVDRVHIVVPVPEVEGFGLTRIVPVPVQAAGTEVLALGSSRGIRNRILDASVESRGTLRLVRAGVGAAYRGLLGLESEPDLGDTYTWWGGERPRTVRATSPARAAVTAAGPYAAGLAWQTRLAAGSGVVTARVEAMLAGLEPFLRVRLRILNRARDHRLRLRFPVGVRGVAAVAGAHLGRVVRPPARARRSRGALEAPVATAPAHRYVAVARGSRGLAVLAPGFFEYEWTRTGDLLITLLRSVGELSRGDLPPRPGHAAWPLSTPEAQCQGPSDVELAIAPVTETEVGDAAWLERLWEDAFVPLRAVWLRDYAPPPDGAPRSPSVTLSGDGLVFSALKPAETGGGLVLRCWNSRDHTVTGAWHLDRPVRSAGLLRCDETEMEPLAVEEGGTRIPIAVPPHGVATVGATFAGAEG
ncbi:MAG TPA: glycosyl hydrolase-related protein [Gemmatimonadales bacterium]|nr:glycosyl hydrolase-related protein [Gemmatimonadales bacterium]